MGGSAAHEFMYLSPIGEDSLVFCDGCGYSANRQTASFRRPLPVIEEVKELCKVPTPHAASIQDLANYLKIPASKTAKAVFFIAEIIGSKQPRFIFAIVRGDMDVNEYKIMKLLNASSLRPATEDEIKGIGVVPGYASPIGLKPAENVVTIIDELIPGSFNLAAGANEEGFHYINTNYGRDFSADIVGDLVNIKEGDACPECGKPVRMERGVEVGNIFQLGTKYSEAMNCRFQDEDGENKLVVMGSYGIGVGRLLACLAEEHHDEHGLSLPVTITPYQVYLIVLPGKSLDILPVAEKLYAELIDAGVEVLFDDRPDSPGVKFNDADLIGCPIRLTVGERSLKQGGVEMKQRESQEILTHPVQTVIEEVQKELIRLNSMYEPK